MDEPTHPKTISGELAELRQRTAKAEEALRQTLRREQAMSRIRDRILEMRHGPHLFPQMIDYWLKELRDLGIPLHELSLQRPSTRLRCFCWCGRSPSSRWSKGARRWLLSG